MRTLRDTRRLCDRACRPTVQDPVHPFDVARLAPAHVSRRPNPAHPEPLMTALAVEPTDPIVEPAATTRHGTARLDSIDALRGLVIALMVLDHVRDFWNVDAFQFQPTDLSKTTPELFLTRWVTYLCAPTFVFLAGVAVFLQRTNAISTGRSRRDVARSLVFRGIWLIVLELTFVGVGFDFGFYPFFQVIWVIGLGMILLAALISVPPWAVLALGALVIAGHNALDSVDAGHFGAWVVPWRLLMTLGPTTPLKGFVAYPALPWFGMMALGYGLGPVFLRSDAERRRMLARLSVGALALFVALRVTHGYGDQAPWGAQPRGALFTGLSFINVSKYPPSLQYALLTLGVSLPLGLALERLRGPLSRVLLAFGRTPMLTYLVHAYIVHGGALLVGLAMGLPASAFANFFEGTDALKAAHWGVSLPIVYLVWLLILALLYPMSRAYARLRRERRSWWMSYI